MQLEQRAKVPPTADRLVNLTLLGKVAARFEGCEVAFTTRKCRALLGYLALSDAAEETRERLIGLLWSETEEERARGSLRQALYELRASLEGAGLDVLSATKVAVALDRTRTKVDAWEVLAEAKEGRAHPLLLESERLADTLLAEFETIDPAFRVWLLAKRQTLHDRLARYLEQAMREDRGYATKADLARALLNLDPTHEEAARLLIRLRAEVGDVGGALAIYKRLWDLLAEEYDVEPSKETQELIAAIRMSQPEPGPTSVQPVLAASTVVQPESLLRAVAPPKLIIGIGAFDASGVGPDHSYLVQGFRRELIANLVRFREWAVRDSVTEVSRNVAAGTSHEYLVEAGAFQGAGGTRLVVTLLDTRAQEYVWSNEYRLSLDSWVDSQQNLVHRIASALNVYLSAGRISEVNYHPDQNLKAYDRWLFGQSKLHLWEPTSFHEAVAIYRDIIAEAPKFSPAYSTLAQLQNIVHFVHPGVFRTPDRTAEALNYAQEAARLDPVDSRAQLSLGWAHAMARHHDLAEAHHELAWQLNENDAWTATSVALGYATRGQHEIARQVAARALALSPALGPQHWGYHLQVRFMTHDYAAGVEAAEGAGSVIPTSIAWKIAALGHLGRVEEARADARRFIDQVRGKWFGNEPASEENIARWTLHCFPFKREEDWNHFRDGLAVAFPVIGLAHDKW